MSHVETISHILYLENQFVEYSCCMGCVRPVIYKFTSYREFLRAFYTFEKEASSAFSYRVFSARAGFKSPNFLKLVIEGQRNLTLESLRKISTALKLSNDESNFFRNLVLFEQAKNSAQRQVAMQDMYKSKVFRELYPLKQAELDYYQNWYCIPIREMIGSGAFREDARWIARKMRNLITPAQAEQAIEILLSLGMVRRDAKGKLFQTQQNVTTGNEVVSTAVACFHKQVIGLAANSIDEVKRFRREVSGSTILISEAQFMRLKELIQNFRRTLLAEVDASAPSGQAVYQINFQLFPLTEVLQEQEEEAECKKAS